MTSCAAIDVPLTAHVANEQKPASQLCPSLQSESLVHGLTQAAGVSPGGGLETLPAQTSPLGQHARQSHARRHTWSLAQTLSPEQSR